MKIGDPISKLIHSSGEDILASYRTGERVLVKDGIITKIITAANYQEVRLGTYMTGIENHAQANWKPNKKSWTPSTRQQPAKQRKKQQQKDIIENQDLILKEHLDAEAKKIIKKMLDQDEKENN